MHADPDKHVAEGNVRRPRPVDAAIAAIAASQHGVVTHRQLAALGLSAVAVSRRARRGALHRLHRGVYAVGHPLLTQRGRWQAAVLACGHDAALAFRSAGAMWRLLEPTGITPIDVVVPHGRRAHDGVRTYAAVLPDDERTRHDGIPVTTPERTLLDLAAVLGRHRLQRAADLAGVGDPSRRRRIEELLERHRGARGLVVLREVIVAAQEGRAIPRSEFEERFVRFLRLHGLPSAATNGEITVGDVPYEIDAAWPERRIAVEVDGWEFHRTREAFEADRERDRRLAVAGWRVVRITWRQLRDDPEVVGAHLRALLEARP